MTSDGQKRIFANSSATKCRLFRRTTTETPALAQQVLRLSLLYVHCIHIELVINLCEVGRYRLWGGRPSLGDGKHEVVVVWKWLVADVEPDPRSERVNHWELRCPDRVCTLHASGSIHRGTTLPILLDVLPSTVVWPVIAGN